MSECGLLVDHKIYMYKIFSILILSWLINNSKELDIYYDKEDKIIKGHNFFIKKIKNKKREKEMGLLDFGCRLLLHIGLWVPKFSIIGV